MTETLRPLSYFFDYQTCSRVAWSDGSQTFLRDFSLDADTLLRAGQGIISPVLLDLIEVASAVYFADRLARRRDDRDHGRGLQWRRRLAIRIGVRDITTWTHPDVQTSLSACLEFLTEDSWEFDFQPRRAARWDIERQAALIEPPANARAGVMLYSGGLDSFAGLANFLDEPQTEWVFVSGAPNPRHKNLQSVQIAAARRLVRRHVSHLTVPYGLEKVVDAPKEERSQRARSFLFLTLGVIAASRVGTDTVLMCENGIGAVNLPLDGTQLGTSNARAANPGTLLRFNRLAQQLLECRVHVRNPFWNITKGEACQHVNVRTLACIIPDTFSCDGFPVRVANVPQCGTCTSCVLRRLSLYAADLQAFDPAGRYLRDVAGPKARLRASSLHGVRVMEWQVQRLREALRWRDPWTALSQAFPAIRRAATAYQELEHLDAAKVRNTLLRLYSQYVREWEQFPARGHLRLAHAA